MSDIIDTRIPADEKMWATFCQLASLLSILLPLIGLVATYIIWSAKKDEMPFVKATGAESINFQISVLLYSLICIALTIILIGPFILILVEFFWLIFTVIGTIKVNRGQVYKYPFTIINIVN